MIPAGINVAAMALSVTGQVRVEYCRATGRDTSAIGLDVTTYAEPVLARGSWQPVPRNVYQLLGLDLQKTYVNFVTRDLMTDIGRDTSGDVVTRMGRRYQVESATPWGDVAGFSKYLLVLVPGEGAPA